MTTNELREKVCGAFYAKHGHNGSCGYLDRHGLLELGAELGALVAPYAIGKYDAGKLTGYLLGETESKPDLSYTLVGAEAMAKELNEMPAHRAMGRVYVVIPTEVRDEREYQSICRMERMMGA